MKITKCFWFFFNVLSDIRDVSLNDCYKSPEKNIAGENNILKAQSVGSTEQLVLRNKIELRKITGLFVLTIIIAT